MKRKIELKVENKLHIIYGIFDFIDQKLVMVDVNIDSIELQYDVNEYDSKRYKIVELTINLT